MSSPEQVAIIELASLAFACDGALIGVALAVVAVNTIRKFKSSSVAFSKISAAPLATISDLRCLLSDKENGDDESSGRLVVVRGQVQPKSAVDSSWLNSKDNLLVCQETGDRAVIVHHSQACLYNEWRGVFGWTYDFRRLFARSWKEHETTSLRMVPFILIEGGHWPRNGYVVVNMDESNHHLPLTTVYHNLQPVQSTPMTLFHAMIGHSYPVGLLDEVKILPLGKEITAVGVCKLQNGVPEIKSCKDLPYFLSNLTKDQMVAELSMKTKVLLWTGVILGTISFGILGYAIVRNWGRWKEWRRQRRERQQNIQQPRDVTAESSIDDEEDVPEGQLCVICLMRRRRSAFIPCGHLVCCSVCASSIERESHPNCPLCRQSIRSSVRIYDS